MPTLTDFEQKIADELSLRSGQVKAALTLLEGGSTVPFIARYRKEATGSLDEVQITNIRDYFASLKEIEKRRLTVLDTIEKQGKLTPELKKQILDAKTLTKLEDIYLPYRPKRRTKATVAREKGLEPLAQIIFDQTNIDLEKEAIEFVSAEKGVESTDAALEGARDIIAEWISENAEARERLRKLYREAAVFSSKVIRGKEEEGAKFRDYFDWKELAVKAPSHRVLAVRRGEKETFLMARIEVEEKDAVDILEAMFVEGNGVASRQVRFAVADSFKRLIAPSMETEMRVELKKKADIDAIDIFKKNLRELLMAPPMGQKNVLAIDPGFRTGCKTVCLNAQGKFLYHENIYPTSSESQQEDAKETIAALCKKHKIEVIAIGNGTASRETESLVKSIGLPKEIAVVMVNESGASIYSASDVAREEFPDQDVTVRGAVSIGRRLMDPLAELVKIDPKSIGVGQYQHDVDQNLLKASLDDVVISCVNQVGVELNTASKQLLMYVSGLGPVRAEAVVQYRNEKGAFKNRKELEKVTGLGAKAFEQAAGFLRINDGENPLDQSAVHPESYSIVEAMAHDVEASVLDLIKTESLRKKIDLKKYVTDSIGLPTLTDIVNELAKPGRDPRPAFQLFSFKEGVNSIDDVKPGMKLPAVITNITAFGAFADIGVHQDGLIHISEMADRYVKDPHEVVSVHQKVNVTVLEVDAARKRIALSMRKR